MIPDLNQMLNLNLIGLVDNPYVWIALRFVVGAAFIANSTSKTVYQVNYGFESLAQRPKCFRLESCPQLANFTDVPYWTKNFVTLSLAFIFSFTLFIVGADEWIVASSKSPLARRNVLADWIPLDRTCSIYHSG